MGCWVGEGEVEFAVGRAGAVRVEAMIVVATVIVEGALARGEGGGPGFGEAWFWGFWFWGSWFWGSWFWMSWFWLPWSCGWAEERRGRARRKMMERMMKMEIERINRHYEDGDNVSWSARRDGEKPKSTSRRGKYERGM